jgi:hypothetical protein
MRAARSAPEKPSALASSEMALRSISGPIGIFRASCAGEQCLKVRENSEWVLIDRFRAAQRVRADRVRVFCRLTHRLEDLEPLRSDGQVHVEQFVETPRPQHRAVNHIRPDESRRQGNMTQRLLRPGQEPNTGDSKRRLKDFSHFSKYIGGNPGSRSPRKRMKYKQGEKGGWC